VLAGDFLQPPPIAEKEMVAKFAFKAATWGAAIQRAVVLRKVLRQTGQGLAIMLNVVREANTSPETKKALRGLSRGVDCGDGPEPTLLFPTRDVVDWVNGKCMNALPSNTVSYET
ncbi:hypothetical protein K470DRAFT_218201, partial [Piedraia hortae CBS 480.64]